MNPVQRRVAGGREARGVGKQCAASATDVRAGFRDQVGEERLLLTTSRVSGQPIGVDLSSVLAEELLGPIRYREEPNDALFLSDDPVSPRIEVDPHRLGEAADDIEGEGSTW